MKSVLEQISILALKAEHFISLTSLMSLMILLIRVASPDTSGGTGR